MADDLIKPAWRIQGETMICLSWTGGCKDWGYHSVRDFARQNTALMPSSLACR